MEPEQKSQEHLAIGRLGEKIACEYLESKGYKIIEKNYRRKCGEIDIVCSAKSDLTTAYANKSIFHRTSKKLVFVEVKTLKREGWLSPEDNFTSSKQKRLIRTCKLYMAEKNVNLDDEWQIDVIAINLKENCQKAEIKHFENTI